MNDMKRMLERQNNPTAGLVGGYIEPSLRDTLIQRRDQLREELSRVEAALVIFETEPRVTDALETIMKAMR